jgi:outer membrane biogenesis lipoprotein LolB
MMKTLRVLLMVSTVVVLAACSSKLTATNLEKVQDGMTTAEVKQILGEPTSLQTGSALGIISGTTYIYHTDKSEVKINFVNDKVVAKEGSFQ